MSFYVYILHSQSTGRYYCAQTKTLKQRLRHHNDPEYRSDSTTRRFQGPWELVWYEARATRSDAMEREQRIKGRGIARFVAGSSVG